MTYDCPLAVARVGMRRLLKWFEEGPSGVVNAKSSLGQRASSVSSADCVDGVFAAAFSPPYRSAPRSAAPTNLHPCFLLPARLADASGACSGFCSRRRHHLRPAPSRGRRTRESTRRTSCRGASGARRGSTLINIRRFRWSTFERDRTDRAVDVGLGVCGLAQRELVADDAVLGVLGLFSPFQRLCRRGAWCHSELCCAFFSHAVVCSAVLKLCNGCERWRLFASRC